MRKFKSKPGIPVYLLLLIMALGLLPLNSCKEKKPSESGADFLMYCRQLDKADVQVWADKKWTAKGDPNFITQLWFKVNKIDTKIQIDVDPMKSYNEFIPGGKVELSRETSCQQSLPDNAEYPDSWISMDALHLVANDAGNLINFSFVRLTPAQTYPPYVNYKAEVILKEDGKEKILYTAFTYPCPPHCPKPPEEGEDSTSTEDKKPQ